jgi:hypothetical protein
MLGDNRTSLSDEKLGDDRYFTKEDDTRPINIIYRKGKEVISVECCGASACRWTET